MIVYRTNWIIDKPSSADGLCSLRMRVKWCKSRNILTFALPFKVDGDKWIQSAQRLKPNSFHGKHKISATDINRKMQEYENRIAVIFAKYDLTPPTKAAVKDEFEQLSGTNTDEGNRLEDLFNHFVEEQSIEKQWTDKRVQRYNSLLHHIIRFDKSLAIENINTDTLRSLLNYFIRSEYRNTYINCLFKLLRTFLRWAVENGYMDDKGLDSFRPKLKGVVGNTKAIVYLTWEELQTFYNFPFKNEYLRRVRDVFCFCAFSGLRYSDAAKLRQRDVGKSSIFVVTQKTSDALTIELNDYSREILNRYRSDYPEALALPVISNQKYNVYLKEAAQLAGIDSTIKTVYYIGTERHETNCPKWELLSSHAARRTFVVNALRLGISAEVIMKWTGHSNYEAMKPYVDIVDELKQSEMAKFNRH